jgi:hypothetical protein
VCLDRANIVVWPISQLRTWRRRLERWVRRRRLSGVVAVLGETRLQRSDPFEQLLDPSDLLCDFGTKGKALALRAQTIQFSV